MSTPPTPKEWFCRICPEVCTTVSAEYPLVCLQDRMRYCRWQTVDTDYVRNELKNETLVSEIEANKKIIESRNYAKNLH